MNHRLRFAAAGLSGLCAAASLLVPAHAFAGTLVVANKAEATVSLIDHTSGDVVATLEAGFGPHEVGISPDGRLALVTNYGTRENPGNSLTLLDIPSASVLRTIDLGDYRRPHGVERGARSAWPTSLARAGRLGFDAANFPSWQTAGGAYITRSRH